MVKDENNVWTGKLSLPKGTEFAIKLLKSTVSTTSGGNDTWSALKYSSTLNNSKSYDFGEFTDNLIPNGNFEEGQVKWTPAECITLNAKQPFDGKNILVVGEQGKYPKSCSSDVIVLPPNQNMCLTGYVIMRKPGRSSVVAMKVIKPQQQTLFEFSVTGYADSGDTESWRPFSKTFQTADVPMACRIVLSNDNTDTDETSRADFDALSLISP